jgi:pyrroline-5-carboxylate reductase
MQNLKIGFIGGGNMARSLVGGLIADGLAPACLSASEPDPGRREALARAFGIKVVDDNAGIARSADVVVFAIKPQVMAGVATDVAPALAGRSTLVVSIAAGIRTGDLAGWLAGGVPVVRAMPNTPALLRCGATALYAGPGVSPAQREQAEGILRAVGAVTWVEDESLMDVVTALSGSGPAYFFRLMECMAEAAARLGLPRDQARLLTLETALGAARMAIESDEDLADLRRGVTSPGGTTQAALESLDADGFATLVDRALEAATERSRELAARFERK